MRAKKYRDIKLWYTIHTAVELSKNTTTHTHEWFYENQNKMEAFYRPAVSPFQLPPLSTIYPPLSKEPLQNQICLREAGTYYWNHCCWIFDTVIKIIIIESSPSPLFRRQQNQLVTFAVKLATFFSLNSTTFPYHHNNATLKKEQKFTNTIWH